jgi:hypothetical protein
MRQFTGSKALLVTLALLTVGVILYDQFRREPVPLPADPEPSPAAPPEVRRGLDKTPLLYTGEYVLNLAGRLSPSLVQAVPVDAGPVAPVSGIVMSDRGDVLIPLPMAPAHWRIIGAADGRPALLAALDAVHGVALLQAALPAPVRVLEFAPAPGRPGEPMIGVRAGPTGPAVRLIVSPGPPEALVPRLAAERLLPGEAIVDLEGQLVAFIGSAGGHSLPLGADLVRDIVGALSTMGRHRHPWIGATFQNVEGRLGTYFPGAAFVAVAVTPGSPAARAGMEPGMGFQAVRAGERIVQRAEDVAALLDETPAVEFVATLPLRRIFEVQVADLQEPVGDSTAAGIRALRDEDGIPVVVAASGHAAAHGLRTGDVIEAIDRRPVRSIAEVERALDGGVERLLAVRRDGERFFLVLPALAGVEP